MLDYCSLPLFAKKHLTRSHGKKKKKKRPAATTGTNPVMTTIMTPDDFSNNCYEEKPLMIAMILVLLLRARVRGAVFVVVFVEIALLSLLGIGIPSSIRSFATTKIGKITFVRTKTSYRWLR